MQVFNRRAVRRNRARARAGYEFLHAQGLRILSERLDDVRRIFPRALQIGTRGGVITHPKIEKLFTMDWCGADVAADSENLPFADGSLDLILSVFDLHTVNDVPGALVQMQRALRPDGLMLAAFPGGDSLHELRESLMQAEMALRGGVAPRVAPFADKQAAGALMQRGRFALPVVDSERVTVTYDHPLTLMRELRWMGEGNAIAARDKRNPGKALFAAAADHYIRHHSDPDGRVRAGFEILVLTGWAPHASQPQPLPRGTGKIALADALGTVEHGTGDKP